MAGSLYKIKCDKGHMANALIWDDQTIQNYIQSKKCNSCGSSLHEFKNN